MKSKTKRRLIGGEKSRQTLETASFCVRINLFVEVPQTRQLIGHPTQQKAQQLVHGTINHTSKSKLPLSFIAFKNERSSGVCARLQSLVLFQTTARFVITFCKKKRERREHHYIQ